MLILVMWAMLRLFKHYLVVYLISYLVKTKFCNMFRVVQLEKIHLYAAGNIKMTVCSIPRKTEYYIILLF
jgi:hypothetical protein